MSLTDNEDKAMEHVVEACKRMGWVLAFHKPVEGNQKHVDHIILGERDLIKSMVAESAEEYIIMLPPKE